MVQLMRFFDDLGWLTVRTMLVKQAAVTAEIMRRRSRRPELQST
jgi:hypothetical protein